MQVSHQYCDPDNSEIGLNALKARNFSVTFKWYALSPEHTFFDLCYLLTLKNLEFYEYVYIKYFYASQIPDSRNFQGAPRIELFAKRPNNEKNSVILYEK